MVHRHSVAEVVIGYQIDRKGRVGGCPGVGTRERVGLTVDGRCGFTIWRIDCHVTQRDYTSLRYGVVERFDRSSRDADSVDARSRWTADTAVVDISLPIERHDSVRTCRSRSSVLTSPCDTHGSHIRRDVMTSVPSKGLAVDGRNAVLYDARPGGWDRVVHGEIRPIECDLLRGHGSGTAIASREGLGDALDRERRRESSDSWRSITALSVNSHLRSPEREDVLTCTCQTLTHASRARVTILTTASCRDAVAQCLSRAVQRDVVGTWSGWTSNTARVGVGLPLDGHRG